jgi:hypothetical protein
MGHRPERRRRLHPVGHRDPHPRRDRERTAASACGHNAGKDELDLILPQRFYTCEQSKAGDRHVYACGSRFIRMQLWTDLSAGVRVQEGNRPTNKKPDSTTDVAPRLRRMWG